MMRGSHRRRPPAILAPDAACLPGAASNRAEPCGAGTLRRKVFCALRETLPSGLIAGLALLSLSLAATAALPEPGSFLVAQRQLQDPNFAESVVLVISSTDRGVMGLIVNRPSERLASELLPDMAGLNEFGGHLYIGGPVARYGVIMLVRNDEPPPDAVQVTEHVYVSGNRDFLAEVVAGGESAEDWVRLYAGHAGWSPRQLAAEIRRGDWTVKPATDEAIFSGEPRALWRRLAPPGGSLTVHR